MSQAKTTAPRDIEHTERVVERTLDIIRHFKPRLWFLENPRGGGMKKFACLEEQPFVDVDYCQFSDWGYKKPTRIWGGDHVRQLDDRVCDRKTCPNLLPGTTFGRHKEQLGGAEMRMSRKQKYRVPEALVRYLWNFPDPLTVRRVVETLLDMDIRPDGFVHFRQEKSGMEENDAEHLVALTHEIVKTGLAEEFVRSVIIAETPASGEGVEVIRAQILEEYKESVFNPEVVRPPPKRGPFGEATITLKPGAAPVKQRMFQIQGERREKWMELIDKIEREGKIEDGVSAWSSPSFPVPKKRPGEYRLVVDYRALNAATVNDAHPLPLIEEILVAQGKYRMWSVLDMRDGYHQVPLRPEDRHLTNMTTPRGPKQWTVLVMGLKNGGAIFQRMMEWVLKGLEGVNVYMDDVIVGTSGDTFEEILENHSQALRAVLDRLKESELRVDPRKAKMFVEEVEFCGHVMREGRRWPSPGKLLSIQKWPCPQTVTQLRGFLGLTNYYSCYVQGYAELAAPLTAKLRLNRVEGKKGSRKEVGWKKEDVEAFEKLKEALCKKLELFRMDPDRPFVLRADASDRAIGAVLEQLREGAPGPTGRVPVAFFSRKLNKHQLNWTPREKETYAVVEALKKWAGWVGLQPVVVTTDHKSLEDWVQEKVDTPSGPAGRRARWHEILSKFDLSVQYVPGKDNIVADAMSRYAYPACCTFQDVSVHGSAEAREEAKRLIAEELEEERTIGMICRNVGKGENGPNERIMLVAGTVRGAKDLDPKRVFVVTRSGAGGEVNVPGDAPETKREPTQPRKEAAKASSGSEGPGPEVAGGPPRAEPLKPVSQPNTRKDKGRKEREFPRERSQRDVAACQGSPCPAPPRQVRGQSEVVGGGGSPQAMGKRVDEYGNEVDNVEGGEGELGQPLQRSEQPDQIGKGDTASSSC